MENSFAHCCLIFEGAAVKTLFKIGFSKTASAAPLTQQIAGCHTSKILAFFWLFTYRFDIEEHENVNFAFLARFFSSENALMVRWFLNKVKRNQKKWCLTLV
jgi:hypothetical protein